MSRRRNSATRRWQVSWRRGTDPGVGRWWGAGYAAARKDLDNDHAAAAARARRAIIGRGVWIGCVVRCRRIDLRYRGGHQFPGARDTAPARCGGNPCSERSRRARREQRDDCSRWRRDGYSGRDRRALTSRTHNSETRIRLAYSSGLLIFNTTPTSVMKCAAAVRNCGVSTLSKYCFRGVPICSRWRIMSGESGTTSFGIDNLTLFLLPYKRWLAIFPEDL
jgi:hypothetical protein